MEEIHYQGPPQATVCELKVKSGGLLRPGGLLLSFKDEQGKVGKMRSSNVGQVTEVLVKVPIYHGSPSCKDVTKLLS